ncbi:glycyl radical enzyme, PFL2/glycerol dehydratase family protein [Escherichia coli 08BKT055439]|uniref:pyruvate formate lyase family protein n=1 Tax=Escherichia coli TaxID=562 RepID=UPI000391798B|nr:pyruvate formate lyase family protein [Escherichia coli]HAX5454788.1 hypothetical protein [Escherichia coli O157]EEC8285651.1 hypothetical protein [Escherichia coli]EEC9011808.1 hypothetical protein [Escherichia coli]EEQ4926864.1 hypothetical protein [Escherichia coli]EER1546405.1 hypothetical protein [Escherichia coli]
MTNRISRLKTALFANTREISLERALLYTASHRQTEGEPVILRRAKATAYILEHVEISIRDEELIAGNRTVKPRAGIMSPEMDPYWLLKELGQFPTRPQDRFAISEEDKRIYREELFPYWEKRSMKDFINGQMTDEVKAATSTQIFSINQTDKGQGHIIIDYPRLLNHGLGELVAQMQQHCQQQPENHFYQAALLLLEASQKHILRYAELAETMAASCTDAQRREELLTIAEISRHNAEHKPQTFWQACQLFWYMNIILQYESNASSLSLGRFDQYMLPFYQASLTQGEDPAFLKELLESLWVKCNDIVLLRSTSSARYNFSGVQGIGIANLSDSLHALKGMVFDQQRLSFDELLSVLKANFATPEGEKVRARLINRFEKYGNDIDEVGNISAELLRHYCKEVEKYQNPRGGYFTPGSYTVSAHVPLGSVVGATPDGRFAGEQLADGGLSPMLGQDAQGPTAVLKSVSKLDNTLLSNGTLLNVKFTPATLEGEAGLRKLADFLRAFTQLKLQHIQFNVVNADTLREAQQRPQDYAGLVVRVAGYSAFFVELSKEIQDDIIRRTAHQL